MDVQTRLKPSLMRPAAFAKKHSPCSPLTCVSAEAKIANAEVQALAEVRGRAADLALNAAQDLLKGKLSAAEKAKLVKSGIRSMGDMLN